MLAGGRRPVRRHSSDDAAASFEGCLALHGGTQAADELEQLSSECAHVCNRSVCALCCVLCLPCVRWTLAAR